MSKHHLNSLICPECGTLDEITVWETINVSLDPSLREKVLNKELFVHKCSKCGIEILIVSNILYHDMENKFMLNYNEFPPSVTEDEGIEMPPEFRLNDEYTYRCVYGYNNFREKILILENGLNDIVIERIKYIIKHLQPEKRLACDIYFLRIDNSDAKDSEYGQLQFVAFDKNKQSSFFEVSMTTYYEQKLAVELDPRMKALDWSCIDENWISKHFKTL